MTEDDDIGRINEQFVRGEITLNEYVARLETLASLAGKNDDTTDKDQS